MSAVTDLHPLLIALKLRIMRHLPQKVIRTCYEQSFSSGKVPAGASPCETDADWNCRRPSVQRQISPPFDRYDSAISCPHGEPAGATLTIEQSKSGLGLPLDRALTAIGLFSNGRPPRTSILRASGCRIRSCFARTAVQVSCYRPVVSLPGGTVHWSSPTRLDTRTKSPMLHDLIGVR